MKEEKNEKISGWELGIVSFLAFFAGILCRMGLETLTKPYGFFMGITFMAVMMWWANEVRGAYNLIKKERIERGWK